MPTHAERNAYPKTRPFVLVYRDDVKLHLGAIE
jgi:hypothetical protein